MLGTAAILLTTVVAALLVTWPAVGRRAGGWFVLASAGAGAYDVWSGLPPVVLVAPALVMVFWLIDRGIPGNRARPLWLQTFGFGTVVLAAAELVTRLR